MILTGLLGGSLNPAHSGHRRISLFAARALGVKEVWWLVSPGNPLKSGASDMAPLSARMSSACRIARRSVIRPTAIEQRLGTRYTIDTLKTLIRHYPNRRFIWLMGSDNIGQFHRWRDWRRIAELVPIAVIARPGYRGLGRATPAAAWLQHFVRPATRAFHWTEWRPPALVQLRFRPDPSSATALRRDDPDWHHSLATHKLRDSVTRRFIR
jgi:nicotinate-nucleotide adenylyltransferase